MSKKIIVHGSKEKGITSLMPMGIFSGTGVNGSEQGIGVYSCDLENLQTPRMYAGSEGSVYLHEIETDNYLVVSDEYYLSIFQQSLLIDIVNKIEDVSIRTRLSADLAGRECRYFNYESDADAFYDALMDEHSKLRLPDRYEPEFIENNNNQIGVSFCLDYLDDESIDVSTDVVFNSLRSISPTFVSEVLQQMYSGVAIKNNEAEVVYVSFDTCEVLKEFDSDATEEDLLKFVNQRHLENNRIIADINVGNSLLYVDNKGKISNSIYGLSEIIEELYLETKPFKKIYFDKLSGSHESIEGIAKLFLYSFPDWGDAEIRFDNNPRITLSELVSRYDNDHLNNDEITLYHGTSSELLSGIAQNGLLSRDLSDVKPHYFNSTTSESLKDRVYFSNEFGLGCAKAAARSAASTFGGFPIILEHKVSPELLSNLLPDEDSKKSNYSDSLAAIGTCAIKNCVSPEHLSIASETINSNISLVEIECAKEIFSDNLRSMVRNGNDLLVIAPAPKKQSFK